VNSGVLNLATTGGPSLADEVTPYLNYGVLGLLVLAIFFGWVWAKPAVDRIIAERDAAVAQLIAERDRLIEERARAEQQRDAALAIAQDKIVPLLTSFVSTSQTLIPLLQEIVREGTDDRPRRR
jgi:hypothetical protein